MTSNHVFYTPSNFTTEEIDRRNLLAIAVVEGGLKICKKCGAAEAELSKFATCAEKWAHIKSLKKEA